MMIVVYLESRLINLIFHNIFLNVCLLNQCDDNNELFVEYIGKISSLIEESTTSNLIVLGDFIAAVDTVFECELLEICRTYQLLVSEIQNM